MLGTIDDEKWRRNGVTNKKILDEKIEKGCNVRLKLFYQRERKENFRDCTN